MRSAAISSAVGRAPRKLAVTLLAVTLGASRRAIVIVACCALTPPLASMAITTPANVTAANRVSCNSGGKDAGRQIAIAAIADDRDDHGIFHLRRDLQCGRDGATRRDAREEAFFARQPAGHVFRF